MSSSAESLMVPAESSHSVKWIQAFHGIVLAQEHLLIDFTSSAASVELRQTSIY